MSLKKMGKTERVAIYKALICGHVLVTVKEALAVAPGVTSVTEIAVRPRAADPTDPTGQVATEVILAGHFDRTRLAGVHWTQASSVQIFHDVATAPLLHERGASKELMAVDLSNEPQLAQLAAAVDFEDLLGG